MVNNKKGQGDLKDSRQGAQGDEKLKDKNRDQSLDEQRDTSRKGDKTANSRRDNQGRKQ